MRTFTALLSLCTAGRVWTICKGPQFRPPTPAEEANEVKSGNDMCCTPEIQFEQLCCLDYKNIVGYMSRCGVMELAAAQHTDSTGAVLMQDDATQPAQEIITVCTSESPVGLISAQAGGAAILPTSCMKREFRITEVTGEEPGLSPGQVVLDERIKYLMEQQVPAGAIPICVETVTSCENGAPVASAGQEYLDARAAAMPAALVARRANQSTGLAHGGKPGNQGVALLRKAKQDNGGFFSALQTSGSFTMMQAGGW